MKHHRCDCRLTVIGSRRDVQRFRSSTWEKALRIRYLDPLELSPCRFVSQFETSAPDLKRLQRLSKAHPRVVLLLDYELITTRMKGVLECFELKLIASNF